MAGFIKESGSNVLIVDVDSVARGIYEKYPDSKDELKGAFGDDVIGSDGHVDRSRLARTVFSKKEDLFRLNRIVFPRLRLEMSSILASSDKYRHIIIDAAVLFGAKLDIVCDYIIHVTSDEKTRKKFMKNKKLSDNEIELKVKGQHIEINESRVDFTIKNDGDMKKLLRESAEILADIESREERNGEKQV